MCNGPYNCAKKFSQLFSKHFVVKNKKNLNNDCPHEERGQAHDVGVDVESICERTQQRCYVEHSQETYKSDES